jgi:cytochrome c oxidase assembly factor CtaG
MGGSPALVTPPGLWRAWSFGPMAVVTLAGAAVVYARGWAVIRRRRASPVVSGRQAAAYFIGLGLLAAAAVSPLDAAATTLLSAHMGQHLIFLLVAPPFIVYGRPGLVLALGLPGPVRRRLSAFAGRNRGVLRSVRNPILVFAVSVGVLWGWHLPAVYQAAVRNPTLHAAEHLTFVITGLAFWSLVIDHGARRRLGYAGGMVLVFTAMLASAALGALITFSPVVLYPLYQAGAGLWGTSALADQQLAGAVMWVPPGLLYLVVIAVLAQRWFEDVERRMRRAEASARETLPRPTGPLGPAGRNA